MTPHDWQNQHPNGKQSERKNSERNNSERKSSERESNETQNDDSFAALFEKSAFQPTSKFDAIKIAPKPLFLNKKLSSKSPPNPGPAKSTSSKKSLPEYKIDLHHRTLKEASCLLHKRLWELLHGDDVAFKVKIVTGRGRHSKDGQFTMGDHAHGYVKNHFASHISFLEDSPSASLVNGIAVRGYFYVHLHKNS